ncbi:PIG-L deacetylase family protein [Dactylosporangium sp. NPDC000244]|uniref:PIG-L deacetylase family protein n=1 Tax=Dactylosporangium sp. NPDC000244 TaxID=3154365 RepID=UPI003316AE04
MKVMTVYAHPADTITNCGGTLARHADAGDEIVALILTHGGRIHANRYAQEWRKDHPDAAIAGAGLDEIVAFKKGELERAAEIVGISRLVTLDRDDREAGLHESLVETVAEHIAAERPDVIICDYPQNPVMAANTHTVATTTVLAALGRAGAYLRNLDGQAEYHVKQVFLTSLPVFPTDGLSLFGMRNDVFVDITPVVGRKVAAMDCFDSQGYSGLFARKLIESANGEAGRAAGVNFAEGFYRLYNETHATLPLTDAARAADPLVRHVEYSRISLREEYPLPPHS